MLRRAAAIAGLLVIVGAVAVQCAGRPAIGFASPRIVVEIPDPAATLQEVHGETWYVAGNVRAGNAHRLGVVVHNPGRVPITLRNVGFNWSGHYLYDFRPALVGSTRPPFSLDGGVRRAAVTIRPSEERLFVLPSVYKCTPTSSAPAAAGSFAAMTHISADVSFRSATRTVRMRLPVPDGVTPSTCQP